MLLQKNGKDEGSFRNSADCGMSLWDVRKNAQNESSSIAINTRTERAARVFVPLLLLSLARRGVRGFMPRKARE